MTTADICHRLLELFRGRDGVFAEHDQSWHPVHRALTETDLEAHISGQRALGVYVVRQDNTITFSTLDLDNREDPQSTLASAQRARQAAESLGIPPSATLLVFSGQKGHHLHFFYSEPIPAAVGRRLMQIISELAGLPDDVEIFPKQDRVEEGGLGNLVKLPLCLHPATHQRAVIVDRHHHVTPVDAAIVYQIVAKHQGVGRQPGGDQPPTTHPDEEDGRPGSDFNLRADWARDILVPAGWSLTGRRAGYERWYREPDGRHGWTSASITPDGRFLYVFSTSAGLPIETGLSKFRAYAFLHHAGDFSAASAALRQRGFGRPVQGPPLTVIDGGAEPDEVPRTPRQHRPEFPLQALPEQLAAWVEEGAAALHVPHGMLATCALATLGAAIGSSRAIEIKSGWTELPTVWAANVAHPGSGKSPAQSAATGPLQELEQRDHVDYLFRRARYEEELAAYNLLPKQQRPSPPIEPEQPRCLVQDITSEALGGLLAEHPRGLLQDLDELTALLRGFNQYKPKANGSDRSRYLSMWSSQPIWIDRKSNPQPTYVARPFLCITGGLPPALALELREQGVDDGFTDRFLFHLALDIDARPWTEASISPSCRQSYADIVTSLHNLQMEPNHLGLPGPRMLRKTEEGHRAWTGYYDEHEEERLSPDLDVRMLGYYEKLKSYAARLALICHLVRRLHDRQLGEDVDARSVAMGWALVDHYKVHAGQVHALFGRTAEDARADALVAWMRRHQVQQITARQACRAAAGGIRTASEAAETFKLLADKGWGRVAQRTGRGGQIVEFFLGLEEEA